MVFRKKSGTESTSLWKTKSWLPMAPGMHVYGKKSGWHLRKWHVSRRELKTPAGRPGMRNCSPDPDTCAPDGTAGSVSQSSGPLPFPTTPCLPGVESAFTYLHYFCLLRPESHFRNISIQSGQSIVHRRKYVKRLARVLKFISMDHVIPRDPQVHRILTAGVFLSSAHDCLVTDLWDNCTLLFEWEENFS